MVDRLSSPALPVLDVLRARAALRADTLVTVEELAVVVPRGMLDWVLAQVDPRSVVEGQELYEWSDVRAMLADPPRPKTVQANKKRRAHKRNTKGTPPKKGHLTEIEASAELGISDRTLRKRLLDDEAHQVRGGPVDMGTGKYKHWRFPQSTLHDWWREVNAKAEPPAKPKFRRATKSKPRTGPHRRTVDWAKEARGEAY